MLGSLVMPGPPISDSAKKKIVELYSRSKPVDEIVDRTGVSKPSVYRVLKERGVATDRNAAFDGSTGPRPDARWLMARVIELERENAVLRAEVKRLGGKS